MIEQINENVYMWHFTGSKPIDEKSKPNKEWGDSLIPHRFPRRLFL